MPASNADQHPKRRKKACDLCFTKKIKCDLREPRCSNCTLYKADCHQSIVRRRLNPPRPRPETRSATNIQRHRNNSRPGPDQEATVTSSPDISENDTTILQSQIPVAELLVENGSNIGICDDEYQRGAEHAWRFDPIAPSLFNGPPDKHLSLPPIDDILPIIEHYFEAVNSSIPLFNQASFMRMVSRSFSSNPKRDSASWAAILVVMALGLQSLAPGHGPTLGSGEKKDWTDYCLRNAQSVVHELLLRDEDHLGIQVLVALSMLYKNTWDLRSASILIGMAARSLHRMQLHSNDSVQHFSAEEALERSNVFWVTYIVDKDISFKAKSPSMLSDSDISIPLPLRASPNEDGVISTRDGLSHIDIFRQRLKLAHIQGKVYEMLYSCHAIKLEASKRQVRVATLHKMLDQWCAQIPTTFQIQNVAGSVGQAELIQMTQLHHTYLNCLVSTHGVWSDRVDWMRRISSLSKAAIGDFATACYGYRVTTCIQTHNPPLEGAWNQCVEVSRGCIKLFQGTPLTPCLTWQSKCAHFSGLIILLGNILNHPEQTTNFGDLQMVVASINLYDRLLDGTYSPVYESLKLIIEDLRKSALKAIDEAQSESFGESGGIGHVAAAGREPYLFFDDDVLPEFMYYDGQAGIFEFDEFPNPPLQEDDILSFLND